MKFGISNTDIIIIETNFSRFTRDISVVNDIKTQLNRKIISIITGPPTAYFRIKLSQTIVYIWSGTNMILLCRSVRAIKEQRSFDTVDSIWYKKDGLVNRNKEGFQHLKNWMHCHLYLKSTGSISIS